MSTLVSTDNTYLGIHKIMNKSGVTTTVTVTVLRMCITYSVLKILLLHRSSNRKRKLQLESLLGINTIC